MLTQKQEHFALDLYNGEKETQAYRNHYNVENMNDNSIYVEACRLAANPKIALRLKELNTPIIEMIQSKKEQKLKILEDIYNEKPQSESITAHAVIGAITEHNKMEHLYDEAPYQDNRVVNYYFPSEKAKELTENISKRLLETVESNSEPLNDDTNDNL